MPTLLRLLPLALIVVLLLFRGIPRAAAEELTDEELHDRATEIAAREPSTPQEFIETMFARAMLNGLTSPETFAIMAFMDLLYHHPHLEGMNDFKVYIDEPMSAAATRSGGFTMRPKLLWRNGETRVKMEGMEDLPEEGKAALDEAGKDLEEMQWLLWDKSLLEHARGHLVMSRVDIRLGLGRSILSFARSIILVQIIMLDLNPLSRTPVKCFWIHPGPGLDTHFWASMIHIEKTMVVHRDQGYWRYGFSALGHQDAIGEFGTLRQVVWAMDHYPHNLMDLSGGFGGPAGSTWRFFRPLIGPRGPLWIPMLTVSVGGPGATVLFNDPRVNEGISAEEWETGRRTTPAAALPAGTAADLKALAAWLPQLPTVQFQPPVVSGLPLDFEARWREAIAAARAGNEERAREIAGTLADDFSARKQYERWLRGELSEGGGAGNPNSGGVPADGYAGGAPLHDRVHAEGPSKSATPVTTEPADRVARRFFEQLAQLGEGSELGRQAVRAGAMLGMRGGRGVAYAGRTGARGTAGPAGEESAAEKIFREARAHEEASRYAEALERYYTVVTEFSASRFAPLSRARIRGLMGDPKISAQVRNRARELLDEGKSRFAEGDRRAATGRWTQVVEGFPTLPEAEEARELLLTLATAPNRAPAGGPPAPTATAPDPSGSWLAFARASETLGKPGTAIRAYHQLAREQPGSPAGAAARVRRDALWADPRVMASLEDEAAKRMAAGASCLEANDLRGAREMFAGVVEGFPLSKHVPQARRELQGIEARMTPDGK